MAVFYSKSFNTSVEFPSVYKCDKGFSDISTNGLKRKKEVILYIPQSENVTNLKDLTFTEGTDYFMFKNDPRRYTIVSYTDALYGSPNMQHMEFVLTAS